MQRTFIAIKLEPEKEMTDCIDDLRQRLRGEKIKWVDTGKLHITLRFLGDTNPGQVRSVTEILERYVPEYNSPKVIFRGTGLFRNIRDPRVLWIGMDPGKVLPALKEKLDSELVTIGLKPEQRKFRPHLTLARIKHLGDRSVLEECLEDYRDELFQVQQFNEVIYYESILRPEGPSYLPLAKIPFREEY